MGGEPLLPPDAPAVLTPLPPLTLAFSAFATGGEEERVSLPQEAAAIDPSNVNAAVSFMT